MQDTIKKYTFIIDVTFLNAKMTVLKAVKRPSSN